MSAPESRSPAPAPSRAGFIAWLVMAFVVVIVATAFFVAWATRQALTEGGRLSDNQKQVFLFLSEFTTLLRNAAAQVGTEAPRWLVGDRKSLETPAWKRSFPAAEDPGYLLLSGVDPVVHHTTVRLLRVADGKEVARWDPDWTAIYDRTTPKRWVVKGTPKMGRAYHPLLLPDGDIVFNTTHALVRMRPCVPQPVWLVDVRAHHSVELDSDGTIWSPSDIPATTGQAGNEWLRERARGDSLGHFSADGRLLENLSFASILEDSGLGALVLGTSGSRVQLDPLHLNEIKPAFSDGRYWKKGDLLVSSRHLSALFLYRPSTGRVIWHRIGPWLNQHSPEFLDDHRISVFDNNVYGGAPSDRAFLRKGDFNRVLVYDFSTDSVTEPFKELLTAAQPLTHTGGRARILPDGGLFFEETNMGRHLRFTKDRLLWSRVNDYDPKTIGFVFWSRYLTPDEAAAPLKALAARTCAPKAGS